MHFSTLDKKLAGGIANWWKFSLGENFYVLYNIIMQAETVYAGFSNTDSVTAGILNYYYDNNNH